MVESIYLLCLAISRLKGVLGYLTRLCVSKKTHWLSLRVCRTSVPLFSGSGAVKQPWT